MWESENISVASFRQNEIGLEKMRSDENHEMELEENQERLK